MPGIVRYRIVQEQLRRFVVHAQGPGRGDPAVDAEIAARLRHEIGEASEVEVRWADDLEPPAGQKFRVVECRLDPVPAAAEAGTTRRDG